MTVKQDAAVVQVFANACNINPVCCPDGPFQPGTDKFNAAAGVAASRKDGLGAMQRFVQINENVCGQGKRTHPPTAWPVKAKTSVGGQYFGFEVELRFEAGAANFGIVSGNN